MMRRPVPTPVRAIIPYTVGLCSVQRAHASKPMPSISRIEPRKMGGNVLRGQPLHMKAEA